MKLRGSFSSVCKCRAAVMTTDILFICSYFTYSEYSNLLYTMLILKCSFSPWLITARWNTQMSGMVHARFYFSIAEPNWCVANPDSSLFSTFLMSYNLDHQFVRSVTKLLAMKSFFRNLRVFLVFKWSKFELFIGGLLPGWFCIFKLGSFLTKAFSHGEIWPRESLWDF